MNELTLPMVSTPDLDPGFASFVVLFFTECASFGLWLGGFVTECCR